MHPSELKSIEELCELIAPFVMKKGETPRLARDKVRKKIKYAIQCGQLEAIKENKFNGTLLIRLKDVIKWSERRYRGRQIGLPTLIEGRTAELRISTFKGVMSLDPIPNDLGECQLALGAALERIRELENQLNSESSKSGQFD